MLFSCVKAFDPEDVRDGTIRLDALQRWLENELGEEVLGIERGQHMLEQLEFEMGGGEESKPGVRERGSTEEAVDRADEDEQALSLAEHLVYGWLNKAAHPVTVRDAGRFVKARPLDFPMGVGDLYDTDRPRKVAVSEWVQHLLWYRDGRFVRGMRGQRVLSAMVNELLLSDARQRGYAVYRNVRRRIGFGIQGGRVWTKGGLRNMLKDEQGVRLVTNQLMCLGRDVRTSPMYWSYESKKLDAAVKHLSWCPPWARWLDLPNVVDSEDSDRVDSEDCDLEVLPPTVAMGGFPGCRAAGALGAGLYSEQGSAVKGGLALDGLRASPQSLGAKYLGANGRTATMWWTQNCKYN